MPSRGMAENKRHGGQILADHLKAEGVTRVFSVPGESFLAALDGLRDSRIDNVICRHEGGASMMAAAHGRLTGRPGVVFVTRGPGATNAASGIHVARQDSLPVVMFVGQIARGHRDREAFQEVDFRAMFAPLAKWVAEVDETARLPEYLARAFHTARSGRPGPVVLSLPEDMLSAESSVKDRPVEKSSIPHATREDADAVLRALEKSARPMALVGGPGWTSEAAEDLALFAETQGIPVMTSFRRQDYIDNRRLAYAGDLGIGANPALVKRLKEADLLLVLGSRLGDAATDGYTRLDPNDPGLRLVHVHPDPDELGRVYPADLAITATAPSLIRRLSGMAENRTNRSDWLQSARADYESWQDPRPTPGSVKLENVVSWLSENLPEDAILTNGAGNFAAFLHRYFRYKQVGTQLAPTSGSMGFGLPAAIAASLEFPDRKVVCLAGDGDIQMTLNEFATARQFGATPIVLVVNNGRYGTIRMHQERRFPGRVSGTELVNPDFAALARAFGGHGEKIAHDADFPAAFRRALEAGLPALIELPQDAEALSTTLNLSDLALRSPHTPA